MLIAFLHAGSPLISRNSWQDLLRAQGFDSVLVAGSAVAAPPLLGRQSVVLGVSDGIIRKPDFEASAAKMKATAPAAAPASAPLRRAASLAGPDATAILMVPSKICRFKV